MVINIPFEKIGFSLFEDSTAEDSEQRKQTRWDHTKEQDDHCGLFGFIKAISRRYGLDCQAYRQVKLAPPSTRIVWPLTKALSSENKNCFLTLESSHCALLLETAFRLQPRTYLGDVSLSGSKRNLACVH